MFQPRLCLWPPCGEILHYLLPALQRVPPRPPSLYRSKCKLYRYDNDAAEWKERGVGQGRILKHKENKKVWRWLGGVRRLMLVCWSVCQGGHVAAA